MLTAAIFAAAFLPALQSQTADFRAEVRLVNLTIAVSDAATGRLVSNLQRGDFEILEDGVPQKIEFFQQSANVPLHLGIVMDASGSQERFVKRHRRDIRDFLKATLRENDRAMLAGFANSVRLVHDFSQDAHDMLEDAEDYNKKASRYPILGPTERRDLGSAVYDGIFHTIREKLAKIDTGRRALLLFSDGEDNSSARHMLDVLEAAQHWDVVIYGIHYREDQDKPIARVRYGKSVMERLARDTGGECFDAKDNLKNSFARIGEQLRSSYQIAYRSSNPERPGSFRNVTVRVQHPNVRVRHRTGYFVQ